MRVCVMLRWLLRDGYRLSYIAMRIVSGFFLYFYGCV